MHQAEIEILEHYQERLKALLNGTTQLDFGICAYLNKGYRVERILEKHELLREVEGPEGYELAGTIEGPALFHKYDPYRFVSDFIRGNTGSVYLGPYGILNGRRIITCRRILTYIEQQLQGVAST